jgi:CheY-like chemotaxis protein
MKQHEKKPGKILVVDDDPVIRDMMVEILEFEGYPIQSARNGLAALEILRGSDDYLVFLDYLMPVLNGRELCAILASEPTLQHRHVIVLMSALDTLSEASTICNVEATLPKPFAVEDVVTILQRFLSVGINLGSA